jgi:histidinol-phosphate aminotransferase
MTLSRRNLLKQFGAGVAASSLLTPARAAATVVAAGAEGASFTSESASKLDGPVRLDRNENAYGASEKAIAAIRQSAGQVSRYGDTDALRKTIAAHHSESRAESRAETHAAARAITADHIVLGCGSTDVLRMAAGAFLGAGKTLIQATPTCELMATFAREKGAAVKEVPLRKDFAHDLAAMLEHSGGGASGLIYVCNPNTPTGTLTTRKDLEGFLVKVPPSFQVVIDEAYHHYAGGSGAYRSFAEHPPEDPRVIVTRTFSAAYGLAGARVGYAVASADAASEMNKVALPLALSRSGVAAASAALSDPQHVERCVKRNFDDRQEFLNQVNARMLRTLDSHANFVCLNVMRPAAEISEHYAKNNFILAPLIPSLPNYLRIALGTPQEMHEFWRVWDLLGSHPMSM